MTSENVPSAGAFREEHLGANVELPYAGFNTFLKTDTSDVETVGNADAAVIGIPYDSAVSNRPGARYGPQAIRSASAWWAYLSGYKGGLTNMRTGKQIDFSQLSLVDCGDVPVFPMDRETTAESISAHVATVAEQGTMPIVLGGDHYCTYPAFRGFAAGTGYDSVGLVQIDAHTDTTAESPIFGSHFHGSSIHQITESPYTDLRHVSQIGIRGYESPKFFEFADKHGLNLFTMREVRESEIRSVVEDAIEAAAAETDIVYVTFDIDAIDPSTAPGTGTPEPGGLTADEALTMMETLGKREEVGMVDLMEVAPTFGDTDRTASLAAYLLVTLLERQFAE